MFRSGGCSAVTCIGLPLDADAASRTPDDCVLHNHWPKLLLIMPPVSMAAVTAEKAVAAAATRRLQNEVHYNAAAEARAKSEAAAAAVDPELKAALTDLCDLEAAQTRVNALKNKKSRPRRIRPRLFRSFPLW